MKATNNTGPNTGPWGEPLVTDVHQDSEPLTTTRWSVAIQPLSYLSNSPLIESISL